MRLLILLHNLGEIWGLGMSRPFFCMGATPGKVGVVERIGGIGQIHCSWGECALVPGVDRFEVVEIN